LKKLTTEHF